MSSKRSAIYKVLITPRAESDLVDIHTYLSLEAGKSVADRWYLGLKESALSLKNMPRRCPVIIESEALGIELRHLLFGRRKGIYRIIYRILENDQEIHILTIRYAALDALQQSDIDPIPD